MIQIKVTYTFKLKKKNPKKHTETGSCEEGADRLSVPAVGAFVISSRRGGRGSVDASIYANNY